MEYTRLASQPTHLRVILLPCLGLASPHEIAGFTVAQHCAWLFMYVPKMKVTSWGSHDKTSHLLSHLPSLCSLSAYNIKKNAFFCKFYAKCWIIFTPSQHFFNPPHFSPHPSWCSFFLSHSRPIFFCLKSLGVLVCYWSVADLPGGCTLRGNSFSLSQHITIAIIAVDFCRLIFVSANFYEIPPNFIFKTFVCCFSPCLISSSFCCSL